MGCSSGVERGAATCVCSGQTVFEGAVIGQVFTGDVQIHFDNPSHTRQLGGCATGALDQIQHQGVNAMRRQFSGYFDPTPDQLQALWAEHDSVIALDTNVLLGLYRMPAETRQEVIELLTRLKDRLWVPYHVLLEFHRNRLDAMRSEFAAAKQLGKDARIAFDAFKAAISNDRVRDRACWPQIAAKLAEIEQKADELFKVTKAESNHYISPNTPDSVLSFVEQLLDGRTGVRPADQGVVDLAEQAAAERYKIKMGPGYHDQEKAGDIYVFDGLRYDRQYGDYMVWRELLNHSADKGVRRLMLVTSDVKPDWWLESRSVSGLRPQPELVMEMLREAAVDCFWMYTLSDFIKNAGKFLRANVTQKAITDARHTEVQPRREPAVRSELPHSSRDPVVQLDVELVIQQTCTEFIGASSGTAWGFKPSRDGKWCAVVAIPGILPIFSLPTLRGLLRTAFEDMRRLRACPVFEIYLMFPAAIEPTTASMAINSTKESLLGLVSEYAKGDIVAAYYKDSDRREHVITHWTSVSPNPVQ